MPDVKCASCMKMIYAPEGGRCTCCVDESPVAADLADVLGPREYLIERAVSAVRSIDGVSKMASILEYACWLLDAHGIAPPFTIQGGRIRETELDTVLENLERSKHVKIDHSGASAKILLVEECFTEDDSRIGRKIGRLVRALNCHSMTEIRLLARCHFGKSENGMTRSSGRILDLLSGSRIKPPEWLYESVGLPMHRRIMDDTHARRVIWKSMGKKMPPPAPSQGLAKAKGILKNYPALAKCDFLKLYERTESNTSLF